MSDKLTTLEIVRGRLANGRTIADSDVHKLVAEIDWLREQVLLLEATGAEAADVIDRLRAALTKIATSSKQLPGQMFVAFAREVVTREALKETGHEADQ